MHRPSSLLHASIVIHARLEETGDPVIKRGMPDPRFSYDPPAGEFKWKCLRSPGHDDLVPTYFNARLPCTLKGVDKPDGLAVEIGSDGGNR